MVSYTLTYFVALLIEIDNFDALIFTPLLERCLLLKNAT